MLDNWVINVRSGLLRGSWPLLLSLTGACLVLGVIGGSLLAFVSPLIILALIAAEAVGMAMLRSSRMGLFALAAAICLLPFGAIPFSLGFYPTFLDVALLAVFGVSLARVLARTREGFTASPLNVPILTFILVSLIAFIAGSAQTGITKDTLRHFDETILAWSLFIVVINCVRELRLRATR